MKKIITLVIAGFVSLSVFAQNDLVPRIGLKGGLNIATIIKTNDNSFSSKALFGFNGGAVLQLPLTKYIAIQPEVLFSQKGYHATGSSILGDYDYRRYLNFLDIPLLLRINASKDIGIVVGPQYSYLLSTHTKFKSGDATYEQDVNNDNDNITKNIFGGVVGLDINLDRNVYIYGRYSIDFKSNNGDGTSTTPEYKNQVFQFGLGVLL
ncbi:MAG: PorT family protein [Bacteroidetes bacterium]|nr:PorT family protein [Bacteroidota bacterium]